MENTNVVNDTQRAAVEPATETASAENSGTNAGTPAAGTGTGAAPRAQSKADNRVAAQLRREKEVAEAKLKAYSDGFSSLGISGNTPEETLLQIEALKNGTTVEKLRQQRAGELAAVKNNPTYKAMELEVIEHRKAKDLAEIQSIDPTVKSIDDLGLEYLRFKGAGLNAKQAYYAMKASEAPKTEKPAKLDSVADGAPVESEYFTNEQLNNLTWDDLDEKTLDKAIRSLTKKSKK